VGSPELFFIQKSTKIQICECQSTIPWDPIWDRKVHRQCSAVDQENNQRLKITVQISKPHFLLSLCFRSGNRMIRNVLLMATSGLFLFSKEFVNAVAQPSLIGSLL
jgi:hypothetical protein